MCTVKKGIALTHSASDQLSSALTIPIKWLNMYGDFIAKNASAVTQIESGLRSLTYIIPGHYRDSEVASESLHSGVQILSLYHDSLLNSAVSRLPRSKRPQPSTHNRYTAYWCKKSLTYQRVATFLQMIKYTELLWEMAIKRRGERSRWRVVVFLEIIKAVCRMLLLRLTNSRPLLSPPLPQREVEPAALEQAALSNNTENDKEIGNGDAEAAPSESSATSTSSDNSAKWTMPRTGLTLPSLPDPGDISSYLISKVLTADDVKPPAALLHRVAGKAEFAEWLYILRPVVYTLALAHYTKKGDKGNWRPWFLGFGMEFGARQLAKRDVRERYAGGLRGLTGLEREELRKRGWGLAWWTMRGAFWENVTKAWIHSAADGLRGKFVLDMAANIIDDYEFLWDEYYFSTATL